MDSTPYQRDQRVQEILSERREFIIACEQHIKKTREFCSSVQYYLEEAMIKKEESLSSQAQSLAILKLASTFPNDVAHNSIIAESTIVLEKLNDFKRAPISVEHNDLEVLRTKLLELSFLPTDAPL